MGGVINHTFSLFIVKKLRKKPVSMFECMEISETIYEIVVEILIKKYLRIF